MEKKSNSRSSQSQTKTQNNDPKKQDASSGKLWPRCSKKRESCSSLPAKCDVSRRPAPQKGKAFDKRPKPRGAQYGGAVGGNQNARLEESDAEIGSVFLPGSKKHNLNHLLNFHFAPRESSGGGGGGAVRKHHGLVHTNTHKHSKELFLQSNCQFVVKADGDYAPHLVDPDIPVSWDLIEQINVRVSSPLSCPICLGGVVAGRITRCGHSYCWPCLLHYFALSEDSQRPCPICFQPIDKKHLKSVQGVWQDNFPVGCEIRMRLMRQVRGCMAVEVAPTLTAAADPATPSTSTPHQLMAVSETQHTTLFSKLLTASHNEVMDIITREREELAKQLEDEPDRSDHCFIQEALNMIQKRESELFQGAQPPITPMETCHRGIPDMTLASEPGGLTFIDVFEKMAMKEKELEETNVTLNPDAPIFVMDGINEPAIQDTQLTEPNNVTDDAKYFYFYQAADGQTIFLHGLDIRLLEWSWGSLRLAPRELRGRVLRRAAGSVSAEARRRLRCLRHLPTHCPYELVDLALETPYVTKEALLTFKGELEERKRQMNRRERSEKRRERVISQHEQRLLGHVPGMRLNIHSEEHFPAYQPELEPGLSPPSSSDGLQDWGPEEAEETEPEHPGGLSFAKMASSVGNWSVRPSLAASSPRTTRRPSDSESEGEQAAPPAYNVSLSEAISAAMLASNNHPSSHTLGGKKKKHKAKILFTTGIQHRTAAD